MVRLNNLVFGSSRTFWSKAASLASLFLRWRDLGRVWRILHNEIRPLTGVIRLLADLSFLQPLGPHPFDDTTEDKHLGTRASARKLKVYYYTDLGAAVLEDAGPILKNWINQRSRWIMVVSTGTVFAAQFALIAPFFGVAGAGLAGALFGGVNSIAITVAAVSLAFFLSFVIGRILGLTVTWFLTRIGVFRMPEDVANRVQQLGWANMYFAILLDSGVTSSVFTYSSFRITLYYMLSLLGGMLLSSYPEIQLHDPTGLAWLANGVFTTINTWLPPLFWFIPIVSVGVGMLFSFYGYQVVHNLYNLYTNPHGGREKVRVGYAYFTDRIGEFARDRNRIASGRRITPGDVEQGSSKEWVDARNQLSDAIGELTAGRQPNVVITIDELMVKAQELRQRLIAMANRNAIPRHVAEFVPLLLERASFGWAGLHPNPGAPTAVTVRQLLANDPATNARNMENPTNVLTRLMLESIDQRIQRVRDARQTFRMGLYRPGLITFLAGAALIAIGALFVSTTFWAMALAIPGIVLMLTVAIFRAFGLHLRIGETAYYYYYHTKLSLLMPPYYTPILASTRMVVNQIMDRIDNMWPYTEKTLPISLEHLVEQAYERHLGNTRNIIAHGIRYQWEEFKHHWTDVGARNVKTYGVAFFTIVGLCYLVPKYYFTKYTDLSITKASPVIDSFQKIFFEGPFSSNNVVDASAQSSSLAANWPLIGVGVIVALAFFFWALNRWQEHGLRGLGRPLAIGGAAAAIGGAIVLSGGTAGAIVAGAIGVFVLALRVIRAVRNRRAVTEPIPASRSGGPRRGAIRLEMLIASLVMGGLAVGLIKWFDPSFNMPVSGNTIAFIGTGGIVLGVIGAIRALFGAGKRSVSHTKTEVLAFQELEKRELLSSMSLYPDIYAQTSTDGLYGETAIVAPLTPGAPAENVQIIKAVDLVQPDIIATSPVTILASASADVTLDVNSADTLFRKLGEEPDMFAVRANQANEAVTAILGDYTVKTQYPSGNTQYATRFDALSNWVETTEYYDMTPSESHLFHIWAAPNGVPSDVAYAEYNTAGQVTFQTLNSGDMVAYTYSGNVMDKAYADSTGKWWMTERFVDGNLSEKWLPDRDTSKPGDIVYFKYNEKGKAEFIAYDTGEMASMTYYDSGNVEYIRHYNSSGQEVWAMQCYDIGPSGKWVYRYWTTDDSDGLYKCYIYSTDGGVEAVLYKSTDGLWHMSSGFTGTLSDGKKHAQEDLVYATEGDAWKGDNLIVHVVFKFNSDGMITEKSYYDNAGTAENIWYEFYKYSDDGKTMLWHDYYFDGKTIVPGAKETGTPDKKWHRTFANNEDRSYETLEDLRLDRNRLKPQYAYTFDTSNWSWRGSGFPAAAVSFDVPDWSHWHRGGGYSSPNRLYISELYFISLEDRGEDVVPGVPPGGNAYDAWKDLTKYGAYEFLGWLAPECMDQLNTLQQAGFTCMVEWGNNIIEIKDSKGNVVLTLRFDEKGQIIEIDGEPFKDGETARMMLRKKLAEIIRRSEAAAATASAKPEEIIFGQPGPVVKNAILFIEETETPAEGEAVATEETVQEKIGVIGIVSASVGVALASGLLWIAAKNKNLRDKVLSVIKLKKSPKKHGIILPETMVAIAVLAGALIGATELTKQGVSVSGESLMWIGAAAGIVAALAALIYAAALYFRAKAAREKAGTGPGNIMNVRDKTILDLTPYELNRAHLIRIAGLFDILWSFGLTQDEALDRSAIGYHKLYGKIIHKFIAAHGAGSSYGSPEMASLASPVDNSYEVLSANGISLPIEIDLLMSGRGHRNKQEVFRRIDASTLDPVHKKWLKRACVYFTIADSIEMSADYLRAVHNPIKRGQAIRSIGSPADAYNFVLTNPTGLKLQLQGIGENMDDYLTAATQAVLTDTSSTEYGELKAIADEAARSVIGEAVDYLTYAEHGSQTEKSADVLLVLGSPDEGVARGAARMFREGQFKYVLCSGKGTGTVSEARRFKDIMIHEGVPESAFLPLEDQSKFMAENLSMSGKLIKDLEASGAIGPVASVAIVQKPSDMRLTAAYAVPIFGAGIACKFYAPYQIRFEAGMSPQEVLATLETLTNSVKALALHRQNGWIGPLDMPQGMRNFVDELLQVTLKRIDEFTAGHDINMTEAELKELKSMVDEAHRLINLNEENKVKFQGLFDDIAHGRKKTQDVFAFLKANTPLQATEKGKGWSMWTRGQYGDGAWRPQIEAGAINLHVAMDENTHFEYMAAAVEYMLGGDLAPFERSLYSVKAGTPDTKFPANPAGSTKPDVTKNALRYLLERAGVGELSDYDRGVLRLSAALHDYGGIMENKISSMDTRTGEILPAVNMLGLMHRDSGVYMADRLLTALGSDEFSKAVSKFIVRHHSEFWNNHIERYRTLYPTMKPYLDLLITTPEKTAVNLTLLLDNLEVRGALPAGMSRDEAAEKILAMLTVISIGDVYSAGNRYISNRFFAKMGESLDAIRGHLKIIETRRQNIRHMRNVLRSRPYDGHDVIMINASTQGEADYQKRVLQEALEGLNVRIYSVVVPDDGGQLFAMAWTLHKAMQEAAGDGVDLEKLMREGSIRPMIAYNGGRGERAGNISTSYDNSRASMEAVATADNALGIEMSSELLLLVVMNFLVFGANNDGHRTDNAWTGQLAAGTVDFIDIRRTNAALDKFIVEAGRNPDGTLNITPAQAWEFGTFGLDVEGRILWFKANQRAGAARKIEATGEFVWGKDIVPKNDKEAKDVEAARLAYEELMSAPRVGFDFGSFSMHNDMLFAFLDYFRDSGVFGSYEATGRIDKKRDIDPHFTQPLIALLNGLIERPELVMNMPHPDALKNRALADNERQEMIMSSVVKLRDALPQHTRDMFDRIDIPFLDSNRTSVINELLAFFLLNRDNPNIFGRIRGDNPQAVKAALRTILGTISLGSDVEWYTFRRPIDIANVNLAMLADVAEQAVVITEGGSAVIRPAAPREIISAIDARAMRGITNNAIANFIVNGRQVTLTLDQIRYGVEVEGVYIRGSIVQNSVLLPGSRIINSVVHNSIGKVVATNSYIEDTVTPEINAENSIVNKVVDNVPVTMKGESVADAYRAGIEGKHTRMRVSIGYDPQAAAKDAQGDVLKGPSGNVLNNDMVMRTEDGRYTFAEVRDKPCDRRDNDNIAFGMAREVANNMARAGTWSDEARQAAYQIIDTIATLEKAKLDANSPEGGLAERIRARLDETQAAKWSDGRPIMNFDYESHVTPMEGPGGVVFSLQLLRGRQAYERAKGPSIHLVDHLGMPHQDTTGQRPCPFCTMLSKQVMMDLDIEGSGYYLVMNINPWADDHMLLASKEASEQAITEARMRHMLVFAKAIGADKESVFNTAGASVLHFHIQSFKGETDIWKNLREGRVSVEFTKEEPGVKVGRIAGWPARNYYVEGTDLDKVSENTWEILSGLIASGTLYNVTVRTDGGKLRVIIYAVSDVSKLAIAGTLPMGGHDVVLADQEYEQGRADLAATAENFNRSLVESSTGVASKTPVENVRAQIVLGAAGVTQDIVNEFNARAGNVKVVRLTGANEEANLAQLENARRSAGAFASGIVEADIVTKETLGELASQLAAQIEEQDKNIFSVQYPDVSKINPENIGKISNLAEALNTIADRIPGIRSLRTSEVSIYNLRMTERARQDSTFSLLPSEVVAAVTKDKRAISMRADSLGELKLLAEAHRNRMNLAKKLNKGAAVVKLQVRLTVKAGEKEKINGSTIQHVLELMEIDDVLKPQDVMLVDELQADLVSLHDIRNSLVSQGYRSQDIAIVDRVNEERTDNDIPAGTKLVEYEDAYVTSYHYDAALEAIANPEHPALYDTFKTWFRIKKIDKINFNELRDEIEQYQKVLIAA
jgi:hypothetical protein